VLNGDEDIMSFGALLHEAWQIKRNLSSSVSNTHIEEIYAAARSSGAIGGKLLGAGGGGFMLFFVPPVAQKRVRQSLRHLVHVPFHFESSGSQIIFFDPEEDYVYPEGGELLEGEGAIVQVQEPNGL
jgi:D-glycero-alpha-D-manno-heptose-7-phosphate kinase